MGLQMSENKFSFDGYIPPGVSVQNNIDRALAFKDSHTVQETLNWFYETVRNNKDQHLPQSESMDYKQIDPVYQDFGNFNYGAVGSALGYSDIFLRDGAGWAQQKWLSSP